jgi:diguanylate cyclase (GGDEF)-like protein
MSSDGHVLVADDSAVVRKVLRDRLGEQGWAVEEARDGVEALERAHRSPPEVILLDIEMPRMNGYETLAALKAAPGLRDIPVIFLTARDDATDVADGLRRGAHDYLRKPFETPELVARLLVAQRTKALRDELRAHNVQLERLATTDALTGLVNRRVTQERLEEAVSRSRRHGRPLSALMIDVDHFKGINDALGHAAGDEVLVALATAVRDRLRREDVCGRWGGEELAVVLPDTTVEEAALVGEALRLTVATLPLRAPATISVGVAERREHDSAETLVRRADAALYAAKRAGRNTVRVALGSPA